MDTDRAGVRDDLPARLQAALGGTYTLGRELGGGAMSRVFVAADTRLGRPVVVKVLHPDLAAGLSARRFEREVTLAARLQHPHVVPVHAAGEVDGLPYYTMPYIDGESLRERLRRDGALPVADAVRLLRELADALAYAHGQGVIHRDLKPDNVLLSGGHAMVADFGVAKALATATRGEAPPADGTGTATALGLAVGTPAYMAPEQAAADPAVDARADLYALGCVAYELLSGAPPFAGRSPQALLAAHLAEAPAPVGARRPDAPPALAGLVMRLLAKDPDARPQSAAEVGRVLDAVSTSSGRRGDAPAETPAAHPGTPSRGSASGADPARRTRGTPTTWRAAVAALGAVLAVSGGVAWYRRPPDRARAAAAAPAVPGDATGTRRVLVAPFENATGDPALAPVGRMAAEWVAQGLAESGQLEVTAASGRPVAGGEAGLRAAAAENAATTVVSGAYYLEGDSVRLQARVTDARGWTLLSPVAPVRAPRSAPGGLLEPLRRSVAVVLAIARDDAFPGIAERGGAMPGGPVPDYDAYRQFAAGLEFFDRGDIGGALPHWARAAALDSTFASPVLISAQALLLRGRPAGADSLVRRLERRREALSAYERAILDRLRATLAGDRAGSLAGARAIRRAAPGWALGYFLQTFDAAQANRPREALAAAAHLAARGQHRRVAGPAGARDYWRGVVDAHHMLGDYAGELAAARAAGAEQTDGPDGAVHALRAFAALGRVAELGPRLDALEARPAAGALALELSALADELDAHGQPAAARGVRERVVALPRPEGPPAGTRAARAARGRALALLGRDADTAFARLAAEQPDEPAYLAERGVAAARRGARADAERYDARLRALARPYDWGQTPYARARLAAALGDRDGALALLREALARGLPFGPALHADPALAPLRGDARFQALMRPGG